MNTSGLVKGARVKLVHLAVNTLYCVSHNSDPDNCIFAKYTGPVGGFRMFKRVDLPENANHMNRAISVLVRVNGKFIV